MHVCGRGIPIDNARILKYEPMCAQLIRTHFPSGRFPEYFDFDDLMNLCRMEVVKALKKVNPERAMTCNIEDPAARAKKLAEKLADPEKTLQQAEKNVVYWGIEYLLRRFIHDRGYETGAKKRRGTVIYLDGLFEDYRGEVADASQEAGGDCFRSDRDAGYLCDELLRLADDAKWRTNVRRFVEKLSGRQLRLVRERLRDLTERRYESNQLSLPAAVMRILEKRNHGSCQDLDQGEV
jgi:hypothetical protein